GGQRTQVQYANGVTSTRNYSPSMFRLTSISTSGPNGALQNLSYARDPTGNVTQITDGIWTGSRTFTYDALGRLTSANGPFGANQSTTNEGYQYNAIGDILQKAGVVYQYTDPLHLSAATNRSD